ncbi:hypothetical protein KAJ27_10620 [bacterium]|nr:hypothetical protein [bacterium]
MKTVFYLTLVVLIGFGVFYFLDEGMLSPEKKVIRDRTLQFIESLKFKDFDKAATYHSPKDKNRKNIPKLIEKKFAVKPEFLNFVDYEVSFVEMNDAENRGLVKTNITVELLNSKQAQKDKGNKVKTVEIIYYWSKEQKYEMDDEENPRKVDGQLEWYHKLQSSL